MNDWWKNPVLQGPENDYGDYDYLIEELPHDYAKWKLSKYRWQCDDCGKDRHLRFVSKEHFRTLDGWDSISYAACWRCAIKNWFIGTRFCLLYNINKRIKALKDAIELYNASDGKHSFRDCYKFTRKVHGIKGGSK